MIKQDSSVFASLVRIRHLYHNSKKVRRALQIDCILSENLFSKNNKNEHAGFVDAYTRVGTLLDTRPEANEEDVAIIRAELTDNRLNGYGE